MASSQDSQSSQESVPSLQLGDQSNIQEKSISPSSELDCLLHETDKSLFVQFRGYYYRYQACCNKQLNEIE